MVRTEAGRGASLDEEGFSDVALCERLAVAAELSPPGLHEARIAWTMGRNEHPTPNPTQCPHPCLVSVGCGVGEGYLFDGARWHPPLPNRRFPVLLDQTALKSPTPPC